MAGPTDKYGFDHQLAELETQGFTFIEDFLSPERLAQVNESFDRLLGRHGGRNNFEGHLTERIYTLVARDPVSISSVAHLISVHFQEVTCSISKF